MTRKAATASEPGEGGSPPAAEGQDMPQAEAARETMGEKPSDFIRRHLAAGKSAGDIVAAAKVAGLQFSRALIYAIKSKGPNAGPKRGPGRPAGSRSTTTTTTTTARRRQPAAVSGGGAHGDDAQFRRLALELGIARSRTLLDDLEQAIERIIG